MKKTKNKSPSKASVAVPLTLLGLYILVVAGVVIHGYRYELGLKKPSFKVGDCVEVDMSSEFEPYVSVKHVMAVGKEDYHMYVLKINGNENKGGFVSNSGIKYLDSKGKKVDCK